MTIYCVYLTIYKGNKLPPFYIGYSTVEKVNNGYHGTVTSKMYKEIWKKELLENNIIFSTKIVSYHVSKQEAVQREIEFQKKLNVVKNPLYINKAAYPHIDMTGCKRADLVAYNKSTIISGSRAGKNNPMFGRKRPDLATYNKLNKKGILLSEKIKQKMSEAHKGKRRRKFSEETKQKMRNAKKGFIPWNKGLTKADPRVAKCARKAKE